MAFTKVAKASSSFEKTAKAMEIVYFLFQDESNFQFQDDSLYIAERHPEWDKVAKSA
jgi:hypothetical protein